MASRYVARVFPKSFRNGASRSSYYWYHRCFHITHTLNLYCIIIIIIIDKKDMLDMYVTRGREEKCQQGFSGRKAWTT